jgi:CheY-like chemotaxis protein
MTTGAKQKVLFVDDTREEARFYSEYFGRDSDITPMTALSGDEAMSVLERSEVDCVVSDSVRTSDGEPLVEAAKRTNPELPVLLYSGSEPAELPTEVVDGYLRKGAASDTATTLGALGEKIHELTAPEGSSSDPEDPEDAAREWTEVGTFDWAETPCVSITVIEALADRTDLDPITCAPLNDTVDPDALDALVTSAAGDEDGTEMVVRFRFDEYVVRVSSDGTVEYESPTARA